MTDKFREKRQAWTDSASSGASATGQSARQAARRATSSAQDMFDNNPLVGGILAAAVGAALGSTIPVSRMEQEKLGDVGEKARDMASEQKEQLTSQLHEKKDALVGKAEQAMKPAQGHGGEERRDAPFILPERTS